MDNLTLKESQPDYLELTISPGGSNCNLRCSYCCVLDQLGQKDMDLNITLSFLKQQLDMPKNLNKHVVLEMFGAESTTNFPFIQHVVKYIDDNYKDRDIHLRLYTNGILGPLQLLDEYTWRRFNEIIVSVDGEYEDNLHRTKSKKIYNKIIENLHHYVDNNYPVSVAFAIHPHTNVERIFKFFSNTFPNLRYFTFEIVSLWNANKDNRMSNNKLLEIFKCIHKNIYLYNLEAPPDEFRLVSFPKEFLSTSSYSKYNHYSCFDTNRTLSLDGNVYACRDLSLSVDDPNVFFRSRDDSSISLKDLQLDRETDTYKDKVRVLEQHTPCFIKAYEWFENGIDLPEWITDEDFQDLIVRPVYDLMWDTFSLLSKSTNKKFIDRYKTKVNTYTHVLEAYTELVEPSK